MFIPWMYFDNFLHFWVCFPTFTCNISLFSQLDLQPWRFIKTNHQQQTCPKSVQNEGGKLDHVQIKVFFHDHFILLTWHVWILWYFVCGCLILSASMSHIGSLVENMVFQVTQVDQLVIFTSEIFILTKGPPY
jgi:hypothetical protein